MYRMEGLKLSAPLVCTPTRAIRALNQRQQHLVTLFSCLGFYLFMYFNIFGGSSITLGWSSLIFYLIGYIEIFFVLFPNASLCKYVQLHCEDLF